MLKICFEGETPNDNITSINVANALIESNMFNGNQLNEIAEHLFAYTKRTDLDKICGFDHSSGVLAGVDI